MSTFVFVDPAERFLLLGVHGDQTGLKTPHCHVLLFCDTTHTHTHIYVYIHIYIYICPLWEKSHPAGGRQVRWGQRRLQLASNAHLLDHLQTPAGGHQDVMPSGPICTIWSLIMWHCQHQTRGGASSVSSIIDIYINIYKSRPRCRPTKSDVRTWRPSCLSDWARYGYLNSTCTSTSTMLWVSELTARWPPCAGVLDSAPKTSGLYTCLCAAPLNS